MFDKLDFITEKYKELSEKVADPAVIADQKTWQKHIVSMIYIMQEKTANFHMKE